MLETEWQTSSFCGGNGGNNCIEVRSGAGAVQLRESERPEQIVTATPDVLRALILGAKAGEFDHLTR
ncbi:DUF397 domain-containing protein [Streptomyces carminius]|uniref:DUF397 domain-containing protein n=1 Tax=Streptomyces carminius TaxID=2665496 RepID=A0A2M8M5H6_9ACTN|nr:DUF397 domain-containing protein [Streptomyces carminius]PJE99471.1 DUF397 domain-containing protein [Streptomyces carminius]